MKLTWVPDNAANRCLFCENEFHMTRRRHHCRYCGRLFCWNCLPFEVPLPTMGYDGAVKVCQGCASLLEKDCAPQRVGGEERGRAESGGRPSSGSTGSGYPGW